MAMQSQQISVTDVSRMVSLVTGLPPELQEIVNLSGRVHSLIASNSALRAGSFGPENIKSLIYSSMSAEVLDLLDPAKRAEAQRAQAQNANVTSAQSIGASAALGRFVNGVWVEGKGESTLSTRGGNQFAEIKSKASAAETAPGTGYSWLTAANQNVPGFRQAQVAHAANFLKNAGLSREDVNHDTRHMVHLRKYENEIGGIIGRQRAIDRRRANGENVEDDQARLDDDKKTTRGRMTPAQQKHFDQLKAIRRHEEKRVQLEGVQQAIHETAQPGQVALNEQIGVAKRVEQVHQADVAARASSSAPSASESRLARLARNAGGNESPAPTSQSATAPPPATATPQAQAENTTDGKSAAGQRHAVSPKALNPVV